MRGHFIQVSGPGRAGLEPFEVAEPLPADAIEGPAVASAVSPGTEIGWAFNSSDPKRFPVATGYAMVFRVEQAGPESGFQKGELAFCMSNHRSVVRTKGADAWHLPAGIDPADASLGRLAGVSWSTLTTTLARPPARVAVTGLGIVGNLAAQILAAAGYRVVACDPVAGRRALLTGRNIELRERLPLEDSAWAQQIELVVECSGHEAAVLDACNVVKKGGEVVMVGVPWTKRTELSAFELLNTVFHKYVQLRSGWEWQVAGAPTEFRRGSIRENIAAAFDWIATERIRVRGLYEKVSPKDCETVYRTLQQQKGGPVTAVFDWSLLE